MQRVFPPKCSILLLSSGLDGAAKRKKLGDSERKRWSAEVTPMATIIWMYIQGKWESQVTASPDKGSFGLEMGVNFGWNPCRERALLILCRIYEHFILSWNIFWKWHFKLRSCKRGYIQKSFIALSIYLNDCRRWKVRVAESFKGTKLCLKVSLGFYIIMAVIRFMTQEIASD